MMAERLLKPIRTTDDLRNVLRWRVADLGVTFETVDDFAGLPTRYTWKLLGSAPIKHIRPISFTALLGALAIQLIPVEDPEALARVQRRLVPLQRINANGWRADFDAIPGHEQVPVAMASAVMA
jgi:hypothetical protein